MFFRDTEIKESDFKLVCGYKHSLMYSPDALWGCGANDQGQLGLEEKAHQKLFTPIPLPPGVIIKKVVAGSDYTLLLTANNELYATGFNLFGQLGLGDKINRNCFTQVPLPTNIIIVDVIAGSSHNLLITADNQLGVCGLNNVGQLGLSYIDECLSFIFTPQAGVIKRVAAGASHTLLVINNGIGDELYTCGYNHFGQLGSGNFETRNQFTKIPLPLKITIDNVIAGPSHSFVLTSQGLYACGKNSEGQLGLGNNDWCFNTLQKVPLNPGIVIKNLVTSVEHTFLLTGNLNLYICGYKSNGDFNLHKTENSNSFQQYISSEGIRITALAGGNYHLLALNFDDYLFAWGQNDYGQLGLERVFRVYNLKKVNTCPWIVQEADCDLELR